MSGALDIRIQKISWLVTLGLMIASICASHSAAAPLSEILKRNELVICAYADALPYSKQNGTPEGFQIELGRALANELGIALRTHFMRLHREPRKGECDALVSVAVPKSPEHDADYLVSDPYMRYRPVLVVPLPRPMTASLAEIAPGHVAVQSGSWAHFLLTQRNIPVWVRFRTDDEIIAAVESGQTQAGIVSRISYAWYRKLHPDAQVREATELSLDDDLGFDVGIGMMDADDALLEQVNTAVARMRQNGTFTSVLGRYGIELEEPSTLHIPHQ